MSLREPHHHDESSLLFVIQPVPKSTKKSGRDPVPVPGASSKKSGGNMKVTVPGSPDRVLLAHPDRDEDERRGERVL